MGYNLIFIAHSPTAVISVIWKRSILTQFYLYSRFFVCGRFLEEALLIKSFDAEVFSASKGLPSSRQWKESFLLEKAPKSPNEWGLLWLLPRPSVIQSVGELCKKVKICENLKWVNLWELFAKMAGKIGLFALTTALFIILDLAATFQTCPSICTCKWKNGKIFCLYSIL